MYDPIYMIIGAVGAGLSALAAARVKSTFTKWSSVGTQQGLTGAQAAKQMLERQGVFDCTIEPIRGMLSDHYDPRDKTLRLSEGVYNQTSIAAIGVACHEAGHALQHATGYKFLQMRSKLVPVTGLTSKMAMPVIMGGFILASSGSLLGQKILILGCILMAVAVLFSVVTLPVEWDASARAKRIMVSSGIVGEHELTGANKVLNAAFLTYLASAVTSVMSLLYFMYRAGLIGGRR